MSAMQQEHVFQVIDIVRGTTVDGPGFRTAIYLAGCNHKCKGCHNPHSWDQNTGKKMTLQQIIDIVVEEDFDVTLSGGDPLFNPEAATILAREINSKGYSVWLYTGYKYEDILRDERRKKILQYVECLVDGPYIEALRDPDLLFRGSSNQRLIYL